MAAYKDTEQKFPAKSGPDEPGTMLDRAMRKAEQNKREGLIPQPKGEDRGKETPTGKAVKRVKPQRPERPGTEASGKATVSPEVERGTSISAALLKGAALTPEFRHSGALRGLLGGASVGMDFDTALTQYRQSKEAQTAAKAAMSARDKGARPETPSNVPPDAEELARRRQNTIEVD